jgi:hypothetical protein
MPGASKAQITVVLPVIDVSSRAVDHVRRTHQQTLPRERYRVVASNGATAMHFAANKLTETLGAMVRFAPQAPLLVRLTK